MIKDILGNIVLCLIGLAIAIPLLVFCACITIYAIATCAPIGIFFLAIEAYLVIRGVLTFYDKTFDKLFNFLGSL